MYVISLCWKLEPNDFMKLTWYQRTRILPESGLCWSLQWYATPGAHLWTGSCHRTCVWLMVFPVSHKASRRLSPGPVLESMAWRINSCIRKFQLHGKFWSDYRISLIYWTQKKKKVRIKKCGSTTHLANCSIHILPKDTLRWHIVLKILGYLIS